MNISIYMSNINDTAPEIQIQKTVLSIIYITNTLFPYTIASKQNHLATEKNISKIILKDNSNKYKIQDIAIDSKNVGMKKL